MTKRSLLSIGFFGCALGLSLASGCGDRTIEPEKLDSRALYGFESCDDLMAYTAEHALEMLDAYDDWGGYGVPGVDEGDASGGGDDGGDGDGEGGMGPDYSDTNVQEAGVDEPDIVKTDGKRILAVARGSLHYVDPTGMVPELRGSLELPTGWGTELFLWGDRALVITRTDNYEVPDAIQPEQWQGQDAWVEVTTLTEVDLSDPADMQVVRTTHLGGGYVSARLVDSVARIVLRSNPVGLQFKGAWDFYPDHEYPGWKSVARGKARAHNEQVLADATPENWLPQYVLDPGGEGEASHGLLVGCEEAMRPGDASGLGLLSVVTVDLDTELAFGESVGVFSTGETVYASKDALYVATQPWWWWGWGIEGDGGVGEGGGAVDPEPTQPPPDEPDPETGGGDDPDAPSEPPSDLGELQFRAGDDDGIHSYVHKFDITDPARADYVSSGEVPGYLLSQWSMSEHEGDLRVASTDPGVDWEDEQHSFVTILRPGAEGLEQIGQVGGLGEGERIYAVRMIGTTGYVVTFRQVDPLYTLDLGDPTAPAVLGELKIPGYSAYLHPVGEGLLLGVGQDATDEGQLLGAQVSLFDVSDLESPTRLHTHDLGEGSSDVEFDHRAFLYWPKTGLAAIPVQSWWWDQDGEYFESRIVGLTVDRDAGFTHVGDIQHPTDPNEPWDWLAVPRRSLVIDDVIYTLSERGLKASGLGDFADVGWVEF